MKTYSFYIKSHCAAPDWEEDIKANNKSEAVQYFYDKLKKYDYTKQDIRRMIWQQK